MEDQFVPFELAVKLKELGFDAPCLGVWNIPNDEYEVTLVYGGKLHEGYINDIQSFKVCAPLWQQVARFLSISSNNQINITINGKDDYEALFKKFEKAIKDLRDLQNHKSFW